MTDSKSCDCLRGFSDIVKFRGGFSRPYFVPFISKGFEHSFFVFMFQDLNFIGGVGSVENSVFVLQHCDNISALIAIKQLCVVNENVFRSEARCIE